jgi:UDP-2,3-diacylglucosamine pyrophosphatase LpxH
MLSHDEVYNCLAGAFAPSGRSGTQLVARCLLETLELEPGRAFIFLPDCHLLAKVDSDKYPNTHFVLDAEYRRLVDALVALKAAHRGEVAITHLGDLFDIWRARGKATDKGKADRVASQYSDVLEKLINGPPGGLRADILAGNHDYVLHELSEWNWPRFRILENPDPRLGDVLILHGDQFDWLERLLDDKFQAGVVRLATWVSAGKHELDQQQQDAVEEVNKSVPQGDKPVGAPTTDFPAPLPDPLGALPAMHNVVTWSVATARTAAAHFYKGARQLALELKHHGHDIRLVVVGHTHSARIVMGDRGDRVPLVLLDCGAWLGQCRLDPSDPWVPSAQVGVLVGNDVRIYQLV